MISLVWQIRTRYWIIAILWATILLTEQSVAANSTSLATSMPQPNISTEGANLVQPSSTLADGIVDFETPGLGIDDRRIVNPYVDPTTGVIFTTGSSRFGDSVVGLVKNRFTSACVEPVNDDQKLGTGRSSFLPQGSIGLAGFPIIATFPTPLAAFSTVWVEFQTAAGISVQLRLYDSSGAEVASAVEPALPSGGTCGYPGSSRAKKRLAVSSSEPVAYAVMDYTGYNEFGGYVFVIDNFQFQTAPVLRTVSESQGTVSLKVVYQNPFTQTVTIEYATFDGTAIASKDYIPVAGTLAFPPSTTVQTQTVPIQLVDDQFLEENKIFLFTLLNCSCGNLGTPASASVVITDDDRENAQVDSFITVVDETGQPITKSADIHLYRKGQRTIAATTNSNGQLPLKDIQNGDILIALVQQEVQPDTEERPRSDDWVYRTYITNMDILTDTVRTHLVTRMGEQKLVVKKTNPLVLFNLLLSIQQRVYTEEDRALLKAGGIPKSIEPIVTGVISASNFLYDVTDGQFALGQITIETGGRKFKKADIRINASPQTQPQAVVGGLAPDGIYTYINPISATLNTIHSPGHINIPWEWIPLTSTRTITVYTSLAEPNGYRILVHELIHYLGYIYDEHRSLTDGDVYIDVECQTKTGNSEADASVIHDPIIASELSSRPGNWSDNCVIAEQFQRRQQSAWETLVNAYSDKANPAAPRWFFTSPIDTGVPNPGPFFPLISSFTKVTLSEPRDRDIRTAKTQTANIRDFWPANEPFKKGQVYANVKTPDGKGTSDIIPLGSPDAQGNVDVSGLNTGDEIKVIAADGSMYTTNIVASAGNIPTVQSTTVQPAAWNPYIEGRPSTDWSGFTIIVTPTNEISIADVISATLSEAGGEYTKTISLVSQGSFYSGTIPLSGTLSSHEGTIWVRAKSQRGAPLETIFPYVIQGSPTSHIVGIAPISIKFLEHFEMDIPLSSVLKRTLVAVLPLRAAPSASESDTAATANLNVDNRDPEVVGWAYNIRGAYAVQDSNGVTRTFELTEFQPEPASLRIYYPEWAVEGRNEDDFRIYYWNNVIRQWEDKGGIVDTKDNYVATAVTQLGIYAIRAKLPLTVELRSGWNIFRVSQTSSVTEGLAECNGKYKKAYAYDPGNVNDPWQQFVAGLDMAYDYVNNLRVLSPGVDYLIEMSDTCTLTPPVGVQSASLSAGTSRIVHARSIDKPRLLHAIFFGEVTNGRGEPVSDQTKLSATVINANTRVMTVTTEVRTIGGMSVYKIKVPADNPETPDIEGGKEDDKIIFTIELDTKRTATLEGTWKTATASKINLAPTTLPVDNEPQAPLSDQLFLPIVTKN